MQNKLLNIHWECLFESSFILDQSLSENLKIKPVHYTVNYNETTTDQCRRVQTLSIDQKPNGIQFVDFNNDGFKDIAYCPTSPVKNELFFEYGKKKQRHSNFALSVLQSQ